MKNKLGPRLGDFVSGEKDFEEIVLILKNAGGDIAITDCENRFSIEYLSPICSLKLNENDSSKIVWHSPQVVFKDRQSYVEKIKGFLKIKGSR